MPPRIRTRNIRASKENIGNKEKSKPKSVSKIPRKVLGDKTNSASDDNISVELPTKSQKTVTRALKHEVEKTERPRRDRRLPTRYVENKVLTNLSNSKDSTNVSSTPDKVINQVKAIGTSSTSDKPQSSPFKTPSKVESSLVVNRPKRICRLPSRFDDHSTSPIKPSNASTPIQISKVKSSKNDNEKADENKLRLPTKSSGVTSKPASHSRSTRAAKNAALQKKLSDSSANSSPDTNNNPKGRTLRTKKTIINPSPKKTSPNKVIVTKKLRDNGLSFNVFQDNKKTSNTSNLDVYEFTYDPNEEPKPKKKKRKNVPKKRPPKPKTVVFKNNYDKNINKALEALKSAVSKTPVQTTGVVKTTQKNENIVLTKANIPLPSNTNKTIIEENHIALTENNDLPNENIEKPVNVANYQSIRIEDIAADIEPSVHHDDINYSPVNSPSRTESPDPNRKDSQVRPVHVNDPLNLQEDFSFFDEQPVASSSMNQSVRNPLASPWRVEFGSLPVKWPVNAYVKPNMTPAVDSSFISSSDSIKKRHVYTNIMVPQAGDTLPEIATNNSNWRQTSIISFIKEVAERNLKKKRGRSVSPTKYNSLFEDVPNSSNVNVKKITKKPTNKVVEDKDITPEGNNPHTMSNDRDDLSEDKENSPKLTIGSRKRRNLEALNDIPAKSPRKQKDKNGTYFGFDDSENHGQENVSPIKDNPGMRALRSRARPALQVMNSQMGPMRAALPATKAKMPSSDAVNRVYEEFKSAADAPSFPEKEAPPEKNKSTNIDNEILNDDDSQSVHLFEDIEVVHHLKATRKSYGKPKRVAFRQLSMSDDDSPTGEVIARNESSGDDDLADLSFEMPNVKEKKVRKKKKPKKLMSKKEEKEADEWAAGFNSMCEDIEEFPLLVE